MSQLCLVWHGAGNGPFDGLVAFNLDGLVAFNRSGFRYRARTTTAALPVGKAAVVVAV